MRTASRAFWIAGVLLVASCSRDASSTATLKETAPTDYSALVATPATIVQLRADYEASQITAERMVLSYQQQIQAVDKSGPTVNAVLSLNPDARTIARELDDEAKAGKRRSPLHGIPVLIKDNVETRDKMPTTVGSLALKDNFAGRDAFVAAKLRAAGVVVLGKANLSEWANFRGEKSSSGWSGAGGLTRNPHRLDRTACGSSSGSAAAVAAGLAAAAVGTETNGSIVCPASLNGVVGIKPTIGLISRTGIAPISSSQDTAGPIALTVTDAALLLNAMAGSDPADPATAQADSRRTDYAHGLDASALKGVRIGVARFSSKRTDPTEPAFEAALKKLEAAGAVLVEIEKGPDMAPIYSASMTVMLSEFHAGIDAWLATTSPDRVRTRSLKDLIAFNLATPAELKYFGQQLFEQSMTAPKLTDKAYLDAKETAHRLAGPEGIDRLMAAYNVEALVAPTTGPAWKIDLAHGDSGDGGASTLPAVAGYPHVTVPMGEAEGAPVGLSFFGAAWSEAKLIGYAYAFEQRAKALTPPAFRSGG